MKKLNPLTYAFGLFLHDRRVKNGLKPEDVAKELQTGSSSIRLVEAGYNPVGVQSIPYLIQMYPDIELVPLCTLHAVMQMTEPYSGDVHQYREASSLLSNMDAQLEMLFSGWNEVWGQFGKDRESLLQALRNDRAPELVEKYLTFNRYFHLPANQANREMIVNALQQKPQYIKGVLEFLKHLPDEKKATETTQNSNTSAAKANKNHTTVKKEVKKTNPKSGKKK
ncbi:MAG: hypothetical protein JWQ09_3147 [Segetibacter sp.]|nr:hypothetical protein [Segetibacter sp.]